MRSDKKDIYPINKAKTLLVCCLFLLVTTNAFAGPLDSIPLGDGERVLLQQQLTVENGGATNLFVPQQATISFDYAVESGKQILLMVITEDQWQAVSAGEKATGAPMLRVTVSDVGTESVVLERGTYTVALLPVNNQRSTWVAFRARGRIN